jgi:hypothetical protein
LKVKQNTNYKTYEGQSKSLVLERYLNSFDNVTGFSQISQIMTSNTESRAESIQSENLKASSFGNQGDNYLDKCIKLANIINKNS